jgi:hypothetical protein
MSYPSIRCIPVGAEFLDRVYAKVMSTGDFVEGSLFAASMDALRSFLRTELQIASALTSLGQTFAERQNVVEALQSLKRAEIALATVERFVDKLPQEKASLLKSVAAKRLSMEALKARIQKPHAQTVR